MRLAVAAAVLVAAPVAAEQRKLDMVAFFTGKTHAENVLKVALQKPKKLVVDTVGKKEDNAFVLLDTVQEEGRPTRTRKWVVRQVAPGRYAGTLSDAIGPVQIDVSGDSAIIRYVMKEGRLRVEQKLQLRPDGKSLSNHTVARKLGVKFARVEGIVRKAD